MRVLWVAVMVAAGCSKRNDAVCCLTAADCESLGLSASDVGDRGCRNGESCIDLTCVPTPPGNDASMSGDGKSDGPASTGRCDPTKPFTTIQPLTNVHIAYGENHFGLSSDELTAYIVRDNNDVFFVTTSTRGTVNDDFPVDATDPLLAAAASHASELFPSRQEHLLYYHVRTVPMYRLASRAAKTDMFVDVGGLNVDGGEIAANASIVDVGSDAVRLYYTVGGALYQATSIGQYYAFENSMTIASMVDAVALSPDELTLYYTTNPVTGVFVSSRADKSSVFGPGTQITALSTTAVPQAVTADSCVLYVIDSDGVSSITKPH